MEDRRIEVTQGVEREGERERERERERTRGNEKKREKTNRTGDERNGGGRC